MNNVLFNRKIIKTFQNQINKNSFIEHHKQFSIKFNTHKSYNFEESHIKPNQPDNNKNNNNKTGLNSTSKPSTPGNQARPTEIPNNITLNNKIKAKTSVNKEENKASFRQTYDFIKPFYLSTSIRKILIYSLALTLVSKCIVSSAPYFLKLSVNSVIDKVSINNAFLFCTGFFGARVIGGYIHEYRNIQLNKISNKVLVDFADEFMRHLMKIEFHYFKTNTQTIYNKFLKSLSAMDNINRFLLGTAMSNIIEIGVISTMILTLCGPKYFVTTALTYIIYLTITKRISKTRRIHLKEKYDKEIESEELLSDTMYNIDIVKFFQREDTERNKYTDKIKEARAKSKVVQLSLSKLNNVQSFILSAGLFVNLLLGIHDCYLGVLTAGDLVMLQAIFAQMLMPLSFMGMMMKELDETRINLQYSIEMDKKSKAIDVREKDKVDFVYNGGNIEFKNACFDYSTHEKDDKKIILNEFNCVFEKGTKNAVVGYSGTGKSTLFNLIYKLYTLNKGEILIDGQNIEKIKVESLRKHLTICPQNGFMFNESILSNILYGNKTASKEDVINLAKRINIHNHIDNFTDKYDSKVGTLGSKLSGGERQRILLARALIADSGIILLDEPTSSLDNYSEQIISDHIFNETDNKTVIIIAHKLATILRCDKIYVMNEGKIVESGTHSELLSKNSIYTDLYNKQFSKYDFSENDD